MGPCQVERSLMNEFCIRNWAHRKENLGKKKKKKSDM